MRTTPTMEWLAPFAARAIVPALGLAAALLAATPPLAAQDAIDASAPRYSLAADAAAGSTLAARDFNFAAADSAALWSITANFLHRIEAPHWGMVLSHRVDLSGTASTVPSFSPTFIVYEAYARLDLGDWGQLFIGKRRMGVGLGTTFAPGDAIDPRSGFWDQKTGFRGLDLSASLGPDISLKGALSLDKGFDAYAAGMAAKAAAAAWALSPGDAALTASKNGAAIAYQAALDGASGPADPQLMVWALSADAQLVSLQIAAAGVYQPDRIERPSLGLSLDLGGIILQAEGAVELTGAPDWYGTGGARYTWSDDASSLSLSLDYEYNSATGLLKNTHYLLPSLSYTRDEVLNIYVRSLVELGAPSALVSAGITLYPVQGFDLECTGTFGMGSAQTEFAALASPLSPGSGSLNSALGLAARVHF